MSLHALESRLFPRNILAGYGLKDKIRERGEEVYSSLKEYVNKPVKGLKYVVTKLPTYVRKVKGYMRPVGKVFGAYDEKSDTIFIDPVTFCEEDPERDALEEAGIGIYPVEKVLDHEIVHAYQKRLGHFLHYPIDVIEGIASYITERKIYRGLKNFFKKLIPYQREENEIEKLVDKYGEENIIKPKSRSTVGKVVDAFYKGLGWLRDKF